ncbi:MAG: hypothetical protein ACTH58_03785 [Marinomonas foliarum]|uniref:hypothetical protein n=1 Tax=Marinomonas foliarum TaxID=491950 RepID=UPI003F9D2FEA
MNNFQDILHHCMHSVSSVLADSLRPVIAVSCLCLCFFVFTAAPSSVDSLGVISVDPIIKTGLPLSLVFTTLLLVSYWSVMTNINPARQILAFSLVHVFAPNEQSSRAEARRMLRCRAPFFRFR